jgi:hypothetical protein
MPAGYSSAGYNGVMRQQSKDFAPHHPEGLLLKPSGKRGAFETKDVTEVPQEKHNPPVSKANT